MSDTANKNIVPVIGIGASAGGLKAIEDFFSNMPTGGGAAIVIIQHLDPRHKSMLAEIVDRYTEMDVFQIEDGVVAQANTVYIIPPNNDVVMQAGNLRLLPPTKIRGRHLAIDTFFRSLKDELQEKAIAVILSGTGSDGSQGIKEVKEAGGLTLVQTPNTAQYDGMPLSAIKTGLIDFVLPVEEIPAKIVTYIDNQFKEQPLIKPDDEQTESYIGQIFELIQQQTGHDFTDYKRNTIHRRIERRLNVKELTSLKEYVALLKANHAEIDTLYKELLISVTSFFKDPSTFELAAETIIPQLVSQVVNNEIRLWVPACATGEEAYSWAMLLKDYLATHKLNYKVQIFASDIDRAALDTAREGFYTDNILADVPQHLVDTCFLKETSGFRVKKSIRGMIIFADQNVVQDPPYSRLNLVSCRNLLIYLNSKLQQHVLSAFHYALNPHGFLLLGSSESLGKSANLFKTFNRKYKLFQKTEEQTLAVQPWRFSKFQTYRPAKPPQIKSPPSLGELAQQLVLNRFTPPSLIINEHDEIQYVQGRTGKYLEITTGELSNDITKITREGLKIGLANGIRQARNTGQEFQRDNLAVKVNDHYEYVNLIVAPIHIEAAPNNWLLVVFLPSYKQEVTPEITSTEDALPHDITTVLELEKELAAKEEYLKSTIEELETTNEELKSANEEAQSTNEELQSANEELETSREELQSLNEELTTTNSELQNKVEELSQVNSLLHNLFASTRIATIFLDKQLRIFEFTPAISEIIDLRRGDFGRSIGQFTHNLEYDALVADAEEVLESLVPKEAEVKTPEEQYFWMRIIPYRTLDDAIEGVVITFTDITEKKKQDEELEKHRHHLEQLVEERTGELKRSQAMLARTEKIANVGSWEWEIATDTIIWSEEVYRIFGLDPAKKPPSFAEHPRLFPPEAMDKLRNAVEAAVEHGTPYQMETQACRQNGDLFYCVFRGYPEWGPDGNVVKLFGSFQDITERKETELVLQEREATFRNIANSIPGLVLRYKLNPDGSDELLFISKGVEEIYEIPQKEAIADASLLWQMVHPEDLEEYTASVQASAETLSLWQQEHRILLPDGRVKWLRGRGVPTKHEDGSIVWDTLGVDITERKEAELALAENKKFTDAIINLSPTMLYIYDLEKEQNVWANFHHKQFFEEVAATDSTKIKKNELADVVHPDDFARVLAETETLIEGPAQTSLNLQIRIKKNEQWRWFSLSIAVFERNQAGQVTQVIGALNDITERKQTEQKAKNLVNEQARILDSITDGFFALNQNMEVEYFNEAAERIQGLVREDVVGRHLFDVFPEARGSIFEKRYTDALKNQTTDSFEVYFEPYDYWYKVNVYPYDGKISVYFQVINEQKEAEQALKKSEQKYRQLFDFMPVGITVADANQNIVDSNQASEEILGIERTTHQNRTIDGAEWQIIKKDGTPMPPEEYPSVRAVKEKQLSKNIEMGLVKENNEVTWINVSAMPLVSDPDKAIIAYIDITEKVAQEQKLAGALKEKEILLKEIHHRVKNNLQIISSMLNLQSTYYGDDDRSTQIFKDSQNRIRSMALIHEKLYQSENLGHIEMKPYIDSLSRHLFRSYADSIQTVSLQQDIASIVLDIDLVVPCGLIINELVSNALKHAFLPGQSGQVTISLQETTANQLRLMVSNRGGVPFPPDLDIETTQTLGLQLINALVQQLQGTLTLTRGDETIFIIEFPHQSTKPKERINNE